MSAEEHDSAVQLRRALEELESRLRQSQDIEAALRQLEERVSRATRASPASTGEQPAPAARAQWLGKLSILGERCQLPQDWGPPQAPARIRELAARYAGRTLEPALLAQLQSELEMLEREAAGLESHLQALERERHDWQERVKTVEALERLLDRITATGAAPPAAPQGPTQTT